MSTSYTKRKRAILITLTVVVFFLVVAKISTSKHSDLQEVLQNIPNESMLGLSRLISNENEKKQDEFLVKLEKMSMKFYADQEERLVRLEKQNEQLLSELKSLKSPSAKSSLRDKLVYLYPYDPTVKFPAYIWQTWKHGLNDERFEQKYRDGESQWAWKNPDFVHELFNDDTAHTMIKYLYHQIPEIVQTYEDLPEVILKMDFFRYLILYAKGGVYADIDTYPLQPIPNWIPDNVSADELGMIIAIESDSKSPNWRDEQVRRLQFCQFVLQAKPGHPILREIIATIVQKTQDRKHAKGVLSLESTAARKSLEISAWTGSGAWTDVVFHYFNDYIQSSVFQKITWKDFTDLQIPKLVSDTLVLPVKSFASELEIPKDGKINDQLAFVKHYSASIWRTG